MNSDIARDHTDTLTEDPHRSDTVLRLSPGGEQAPEGPADRILLRLRRLAPVLLRLSLGVVFIWFGALKLFDVSPVAGLVAGTIPLPESALLPLLGAFEVVLGLALAMGIHPAVAMVAAGHLTGTFLVLLVSPEVAFQNGNPLLLTTEGEFVVKNLVLIAAALTVTAIPGGARPDRRRLESRRA